MMTREEPAFKIKNANFPLFVLHIHTTDMDKFKTELETRITQSPDFFSNAPMVLGLAAIADTGTTPDFADLVSFMRILGMSAAGVIDGSPEQREAAVQAGLGLFPDAPSRPAPQTVSPPEPPLKSTLQLQPELPGFEATTEPVKTEVEKQPVNTETEIESSPTDQPWSAPAHAHRPTMVIDKPVRTGQRIYADGDIHIYAPMRGRAIAGAHGNSGARIFVQRLEAELISIAGCFQVFENGIPENVRGKPAQVHLDGSRLVFQTLPG